MGPNAIPQRNCWSARARTSRARTAGSGPVLNTQAWDSSKFPEVMRDQSHAEAYSVSRDEEVQRTNRMPGSFKRGPQPPVDRRCLTSKGCHVEWRNELVQSLAVLRRTSAFAYAIFELRECNGGDANVPHRLRRESFEDRGRPFPDDVDAEVRIEHQLHQNVRRRFWTSGCRLPSAMKSSVNLSRLSKSAAHDRFFGRRISESPLRRISTSSSSR